MFTCVCLLNPINPLLGTKLGFFPSPLHISTSSRLTLTETFLKDHEFACSTALRSSTEEIESGG